MVTRVCLALTLCLALCHAAALDRARYEEMVELIEDNVEPGEEQNAFIEAVEDYIEIRDDALLQLVAVIANDSAGEQEGNWQGIVSRLTGIPVLASVDDELTSEVALDLYERFMDEEQEWVSALTVLDTAAFRDDIVSMRIRLANMTTQLDEKWEGLLDDDGRLDERQLKVMADIYEIVSGLARDSDGHRQTARNAAEAVSGTLSNVDVTPESVPGPVASAIAQLIAILAEAAKAYNQSATAFEQLRPQIRELAGQELGLLIDFNETRADTQLFMNENGYDVMKELFGEASEELIAFDDVGTDGQQDDAEVFTELVAEALAEHLEEGGDIFNTFVAKHNLKFFGPVGPDISEFLVETEVWLDQSERMSAIDLQRFLSAWRSDAGSFFGVSLSGDGITDVERQYIEEQLRRDLAELQRAIDQAGQAFTTENLRLLYDRRDIIAAIK